MFRHGPSCLKGPVTRRRDWWTRTRRGRKSRQTLQHRREATDMNASPQEAQRQDAPIRKDLVERVRREIAAGTYETPEKWETALHRLLQQLEEEE